MILCHKIYLFFHLCQSFFLLTLMCQMVVMSNELFFFFFFFLCVCLSSFQSVHLKNNLNHSAMSRKTVEMFPRTYRFWVMRPFRLDKSLFARWKPQIPNLWNRMVLQDSRDILHDVVKNCVVRRLLQSA